MLQEKGILENDKLLIEVYIKVLEVVDGEGEEDVVPKKKETVEIKINGFQILVSQVYLSLKGSFYFLFFYNRFIFLFWVT